MASPNNFTKLIMQALSAYGQSAGSSSQPVAYHMQQPSAQMDSQPVAYHMQQQPVQAAAQPVAYRMAQSQPRGNMMANPIRLALRRQ